ncbi:MAG: DUF4097 family beta strand repeat-containing protein [Bacillota bacterium]
MVEASEHRRVLKMLEEGTINAEEAEKLLKALGTESEHRESEKYSETELKDLPGLVEGALSSLKSAGIFNWGPGYSYERELTGNFSPEAVGERGWVDLKGAARNGRIHVNGWDSDGYRVVIRARVRGGDREQAREVAERFCQVEQEGAALSVDGRRSNMPPNSSVSIEFFLPREYRYDLDLLTSNGRIQIDDVRCENVVAVTSNGRVACQAMEAREVRLETSNGRIEVGGVSGSVRAQTSNGRIRLAPAKVDSDSEYDMVTSNGKILLDYQPTADVGVDFEARTSNGKIKVGWDAVEYEIDDRKSRHPHVKGRTAGFEQKPVKLQARLKTSNGTISIGRN